MAIILAGNVIFNWFGIKIALSISKIFKGWSM